MATTASAASLIAVSVSVSAAVIAGAVFIVVFPVPGASTDQVGVEGDATCRSVALPLLVVVVTLLTLLVLLALLEVSQLLSEPELPVPAPAALPPYSTAEPPKTPVSADVGVPSLSVRKSGECKPCKKIDESDFMPSGVGGINS